MQYFIFLFYFLFSISLFAQFEDISSSPENEAIPINLGDMKKLITSTSEIKEIGLADTKVVFRVFVDSVGNVVKWVVLRTPHKLFTESYEKTLPLLKFQPALHNNIPVSAWCNVTYKFLIK